MRVLILLFLCNCFCLPMVCASALSNEPFNMAYIEVNDNQLVNARCYVRTESDKPFFNIVSIFAANINGQVPNAPEIYFNPHVDALLNKTNQISLLQSQGIKVLLTLLGNHQNAGWSCMNDERAIKQFANDVVEVVRRYHLDGIDIDDEYSTCTSNNTSLIRISQAIKNHPYFKGKLLTKALFADDRYFSARYNGFALAEFLDDGWEMSYGGSVNYRLNRYVNHGLAKATLALGVSTNLTPKDAVLAANYVTQNNFGGIMVYNVKNNSYNYLNQLALAENNLPLKVLPNCLS